jgi:hypothetical protein
MPCVTDDDSKAAQRIAEVERPSQEAKAKFKRWGASCTLRIGRNVVVTGGIILLSRIECAINLDISGSTYGYTVCINKWGLALNHRFHIRACKRITWSILSCGAGAPPTFSQAGGTPVPQEFVQVVSECALRHRTRPATSLPGSSRP